MAAVNILDALETQVAPTLRRVPRGLMEQKAREVLREFCQFTRAWQYRPAAINVVATQAQYALTTPGGYAEIIAAEWVQISNPAGSGGDPSARVTVEWLDTYIPSWRTNTGDDYRYYAHEKTDTIILAALPVTAIVGGLSFRVSLKPTASAVQVDDAVTNEFLEEIAAGVRFKLYAMAGETWSNDKQALEENHAYMRGRGLARIKVNKRFGNRSEPALGFRSPYRFA